MIKTIFVIFILGELNNIKPLILTQNSLWYNIFEWTIKFYIKLDRSTIIQLIEWTILYILVEARKGNAYEYFLYKTFNIIIIIYENITVYIDLNKTKQLYITEKRKFIPVLLSWVKFKYFFNLNKLLY